MRPPKLVPRPPAQFSPAARFATLRCELRGLWAYFRSRPRGGRTALVILCLSLAAGTLRPVAVSLVRIFAAIQGSGADVLAGRTRIFGSGYTQAVESIRHTLPANEPYALVEAGRPEEGGILWLRYDLAPRKSIDLGTLGALAAHPGRIEELPRSVRWIVVSHGRTSTPEILDRARLLALVETGTDGH